ncbi:MAG TPA: biosynthetic peptidoglycan transglycosylase [Candidatus Polarisedimenticolaceae bacterium]|nr:biosynthetic peptidoglycan transglycosylase [Candidatus Polarisedimenticolaceae bacterium]
MAPRWARLLLALGTVLLAVGALLLHWWMDPGVALDVYRAGPVLRPWTAWLQQERRWKAEGLSRAVQHTYVPLGKIGLELQTAVLVAEDLDFFGHGPVDLSAVHEAVREYWRGGRLRGASTLSQQLAKNLFLDDERSFDRKLREARLAWWLEHELGKRRVFELYLNVVVFAPGVLGAEAAARHYYGEPAALLTPEQAAGMAAALPSPGVDNPRTDSARWRQRRDVVLRRMQRVPWLRQTLLDLQ